MNQTGKQVRLFLFRLIILIKLKMKSVFVLYRGTPHFDKTFFDMLRRKMEHDRKRANNSSYNRPPAYGMINNYFAPFSIISFLIGFGVLIHALQWRYKISFFFLLKIIRFSFFVFLV